MLFLKMDDKCAQEIEVYFCSDFFVNPFVDVVVLVWWFVFLSFEMLVEFVVIFKKQKEYLVRRVNYNWDVHVSFWHILSSKSSGTNEHAFQDVNHLYLQFRIRNFFVNWNENVQSTAFILNVANAVELSCKDSDKHDK